MIIQTYLDMYVCSYSSYFMLPVLYFMMILCTSINKMYNFLQLFFFYLFFSQKKTPSLNCCDAVKGYRKINKTTTNKQAKPKEKKKDPFFIT